MFLIGVVCGSEHVLPQIFNHLKQEIKFFLTMLTPSYEAMMSGQISTFSSWNKCQKLSCLSVIFFFFFKEHWQYVLYQWWTFKSQFKATLIP